MSTNGPGNNGSNICRSMVNIGTVSNAERKPSSSNMPVKITVLSKNKKRKKNNSLLGNCRLLSNGSVTAATSRYNGSSVTNSRFSNNEAYAHYLGLQPAVKFKCRKCGAKEFETIRLLNQHYAHCIGYQAEEVSPGSQDFTNQTNLKIVRKVFLCSSCSTYYDSLNLYTHMSLVHNKQICLLCLVMFPYSKDLYSHLIKQHKMTINKLSNVSEMKDVCKGSAFTVSCYCCDAIMFDDNFTAHKCEKICRQCSGKNGTHLASCTLRKTAYLVGHQLTPNNDHDVGEPVDYCDVAMENESYQHIMTNKLKENQWERKEEQDKKQVVNDRPAQEETKEEYTVEENQQDEVDNGEEYVPEATVNTDMEVSEEVQESTNTSTPTAKRSKEKGNTPQEEIPTLALTLDDKIEALSLHKMIKECIRTSCICCSYCNNATKVAVNSKQLIVHLLTKHRYMPTKNDDTSEDIVARLRAALTDDSLRLDNNYLNTESYDSTDASCYTPFENVFACFQCTFKCTSLKELCLHKKKVHQKNIFLCIMCKSNFSTYSDLMCHLCPGIFSPRSQQLQFRCCFCNIEQLPSSFRLMVHLRKVHHTCDICLEQHDEQQKLLNHMNKHKVHHLCYRCGIAYRSKLDISKHLFWKHGTESVVCKKCLQKKWPHVYHFCTPAASYTCEECSAVFSRAVALTVHKRIHTGHKPFTCELCEHKFISRKLLHKHMDVHKEFFVKRDEPLTIKLPTSESCSGEKVEDNASTSNEPDSKMVDKTTDKTNTVSSIDVSVIPPLNLSSSDSDESDTDTQGKQKRRASLNKRNSPLGNVSSNDENNKTTISDSKNDNADTTNGVTSMSDIEECENIISIGCSLNNENNERKLKSEGQNELDSTTETIVKWESINNKLQENVSKETKDEKQEEIEKLQSYEYIKMDHSYCMTVSSLPSADNKTNDKVSNSSSSSGSSSDTESSSSSCGSNCSCSNSSSSSSSSTSDSASQLSDHTKSGKPKKKKKYKKKKECDASKGKHSKAASPPIAESDLDTDISSDDEDFYDTQPQLHPGKPSLACSSDNIQIKKNKPITTQSPTVSTVVPVTKHTKKKSKQKKAKKKKSQNTEKERPIIDAEQSLAQDFLRDTMMRHDSTTDSIDSRSSKRKRVRNKFYGYSTSDEEEMQSSSNRIPMNPLKKQAKVPSIRILTPIRRPSMNNIKTSLDEKTINAGSYALAADPLSLKWNLPNINSIRPVPIEKSHALYCYCRCPYDEVSEMIACDADNCPIEWFHFECVGIMIPPKGKWYCPGCRNKLEKGTHDIIGNMSME